MRAREGHRPRLPLAAAFILSAGGIAAADFVRGDADGDSAVTAADAVSILEGLFRGSTALPCPSAADANDDDRLEVSDAVHILAFIHRRGPPPRAPFPDSGPDPTPGALGCDGAAADVAPPFVQVLDPPERWVTSTTAGLIARVHDDGQVRRVLMNGKSATLPPDREASFLVEGSVRLEPGPELVRLEAIDSAGNVGYAEAALARAPFLPAGSPADAAVLELGGAAGYGAVEEVLEPLLAGLPRAVDAAAGGATYVEAELPGDIRVEVTGKGAEMEAPGLRLLPADGAVGMEVSMPSIELTAAGRIDYPPPHESAHFQVTARLAAAVAGKLAFQPAPAPGEVAGCAADLAGRVDVLELEVGPFPDPFEIRDQVIAAVSGGIQGVLSRQVRDEVEKETRRKLLPSFAGGLAGLAASRRIGRLSQASTHDDILEATGGLTVLLDTTSAAAVRDRSFPEYPGSAAEYAPHPGWPPLEDDRRSIDAALSISADALNQLLSEATAARPLRAAFDLRDAQDAMPLTAGGLGSALGLDLAARLGLDAAEPIRLRIETRDAPRLLLPAPPPRRDADAGTRLEGEAPVLFPEGSIWRVRLDGGVPPAGWTGADFDDAGWAELESGFGWSWREESLPQDVHTVISPRAASAEGTLVVRARFELDGPARLVSPRLRVEHTGGFTAYLNGERIGERPAPRAPGVAAEEEDGPGRRIDDVPLEPFLGFLREGANVLAIEARGATLDGFVFVPELFDRAPAVVAEALPGDGDGSPMRTGRAPGSIAAELELRELEASFFTGPERDPRDLVALRLGLRIRAAHRSRPRPRGRGRR
jgi:hypothetical protein